MSEPVVADAGPLISLAKIARLQLLRELYDRVIVPEAVFGELEVSRLRPGYRQLVSALDEGWLSPVSLGPPLVSRPSKPALDPGEYEAILLASRIPCRFLLVDDRAGRNVAARLGLPVVGTGGVLLAAKNRGLLRNVGLVLDELAVSGFRLSPDLRRRLLELAEE